MNRPPPQWDRSDTQFILNHHRLASDPWMHVERLLAIDYSDEFHEPGTLSMEQLVWIANCPYKVLEPYVQEIYRMLRYFDLEYLIPLDNRKRAEHELNMRELAARNKKEEFATHGAWLRVMEPEF